MTEYLPGIGEHTTRDGRKAVVISRSDGQFQLIGAIEGRRTVWMLDGRWGPLPLDDRDLIGQWKGTAS